eukprot:7314166-Lingulodinium_polyedra.AAC.1
MDHAMWYAFPGNFLKDNLCYGLMFELEMDGRQVKERKTDKFLCPRSPLFSRLYLLTNSTNEKGGHKSP